MMPPACSLLFDLICKKQHCVDVGLSGNVCLSSFQFSGSDPTSVASATASHVLGSLMRFAVAFAYLSHATLHDLQAGLRLQEVFF